MGYNNCLTEESSRGESIHSCHRSPSGVQKELGQSRKPEKAPTAADKILNLHKEMNRGRNGKKQ